jgi:hypothetical protein
MTNTRSRVGYGVRTIFAAAASLCLAVTVSAQTSPLRESRAAESIKLQPIIEAEVRLAVRDAQAVSESDPDKALERFKKLLDRLDADTVLLDERRQALERMVKDRIRIIENATAAQVLNQARAADRRAESDKRDYDDRVSRRLFEAIKQLQKEGKLADASQRSGELGKRLASSPATQALRRTTDIANQVADNRSLRQERQRGFDGALRSVDKSAVMPSGDVEFPKDWKARTKNRLPAGAVRMTPKEKAIMQALDTPLTVNFEDSPFDAVIEYLQTLTGQSILMNREALDAAGINYDTKVTLRARGLTLRTVLRKILGDRGLSYIVKDETIQIMTTEQARNTMVTRVHYIGDLLTWQDEFGAALQAAQIIKMIKSIMDPSSWQDAGGNASITYHHPTRSLVIKQSAEFHGTLANSLP